MRTLYADIIVDISHEKLDKTFQYRVPERLRDRLEPGACVMIPFGNGNRLIKGYVVSIGISVSSLRRRSRRSQDCRKKRPV